MPWFKKFNNLAFAKKNCLSKSLKGGANVVSFALLFMFFPLPVIYVNTKEVFWWRWHLRKFVSKKNMGIFRFKQLNIWLSKTCRKTKNSYKCRKILQFSGKLFMLVNEKLQRKKSKHFFFEFFKMLLFLLISNSI